MGTLTVSGTVKIADDSGQVYTKNFTNTITISQYQARTIILDDADEDVEVSAPTFSAPTATLMLTDAGSIVRANFTGGPLNSESSEGFEFAGFLMNIGSGISGLGDGVLMANSSGDSATITIIMTQ